MSTSDPRLSFVLWITLQLLLVLSIGLRQAMASFNPYISEFEYSPEFHPSRNPSCPKRWARGVWDRRSPEEGGPVGQEPSIEIRAVLVRCPKSHEEMSEIPPGTGNLYNITAGRSQDILEFHGFDRDEPSRHSEVRDCRRKLIVTMKFNNIGKTKTQEEFVVVDHVLDPVTMHKARLLNPFVFKVRQEQVLQLYGLKFQSVVNGEAREEVINKRSSNFTGCDDSSASPTCGQMMFEGKQIPYSQGFCCSCDPDVNQARQPSDQSQENLSLGTFQKLMPDRSERQMFAPLFASPKITAQDGLSSRKNPSLSKRERSLKSSQQQDGEHLDHRRRSHGEDFGENFNRIHSLEDYRSPGSSPDGEASSALRAALSDGNPSRGKIEGYIDAVKNEASEMGGGISPEEGERLSRIGENFDGDIFEVKRQKLPAHEPETMKEKDLTAELVELEREYETLKKSRKKGIEKATFGNHSKCKDFRKLARGRDQHLQTRSPGSTNHTAKYGTAKGLDFRNLNSSENREGNSSVEGGSSRSSSSPYASNSSVTSSGLSPGSRPSTPTISSDNGSSISLPGPKAYPASILRQELVNDKLVSGDVSSGSWSSKSSGTPEGSKSSKNATLDPEKGKKGSGSKSVRPKGPMKDEYADWVIKYGKMHSNRYINSQVEEPLRKYDLDLDEESSTDSGLFGWSQDALSQIADKVLKEFESAENYVSPSRGEVEEEKPGLVAVSPTLNNPEIVAGNFGDLRSSRFRSAVAGDGEELRRGEKEIRNQSLELEAENDTRTTDLEVEKTGSNSSRTWQEILSSKIEGRGRIKPFDKLAGKSSAENSTPDSKQSPEKLGKKSIEPAVIVRGSGDLVKGNFRYQDQSATVIADHLSDQPSSPTEQDYIFLDADGKQESLRSLDLKGSANSGENFGVKEGRKVEEVSVSGSNQTTGEFVKKEKLDRLDELVRDSLKSKRRSFRSIAYDDPFHRGNDEKQAKIDRQIEKEFAEITEALNESSDGKKGKGKFSVLQETGSRKDSMLRDFAVMLNKIPKNDALQTPADFKTHKSAIQSSKKKTFGIEDRKGVQNGQKRLMDNSTPSKMSNDFANPIPRGESEPKVNEIVKQVIKNDYRIGKQDSNSERRKNVAGENAYKATGEKPSKLLSLSGILRGLHIGKLKKKCHQGVITPLLHDDENDGGQTLPPDESTVITTGRLKEEKTTTKATKSQATDSDAEEVFKDMESTLPQTTTENFGPNTYSEEVNVSVKNSPSISPPSVDVARKSNAAEVTGSSTSPATTKSQSPVSTTPVTLETEISIPEELATKSPPELSPKRGQNTRRLSSARIINDLEEFSRKIREKGSGDHRVIERSPGFDFYEGELPTTWYDDDDLEFGIGTIPTDEFSDPEKARLKAENLQLKKELMEVKKANRNKGTTQQDRGDDEPMATTYDHMIATDEVDAGDQPTTNPSNDVLLTVYQQTTDSGAPEELATVSWRENGTGNDGGGVGTEQGISTTSSGPVEIGRFLGSNGSRGASVILVKTYSVSQNPKELLDNYEFPVGVKRVLLKKLNVTAMIRDPVDLDPGVSFTRKIDGLVVNEEEDSVNQIKMKEIGSGSRKNRGTVHEPSIDDLKLQELQEDGYKNDHHKERENNAGVDFDLMMNGIGDEAPDSGGQSKSEFVRNEGLKLTRSFTTVDTLPPEDETTHFSPDDDVNATNFRLEYVMEQPIFARQKHGPDLTKSDSVAEIFYDYESNPNEAKRFYRSNPEKASRPGRLKKREAKYLANMQSSTPGNRSFLWAEKTAKGGRAPDPNPEPRCGDGTEVRWQGKMDFLKLKKHQDILKEYLNWSPNVDTTVMRIFSISSTSFGVPRTTEPNSSGRNKGQDSSTMSILLIEEDSADRGRSQEASKTNRAEDEEILDKLRKTPMDESLMIMPLVQKNKSNATESAREIKNRDQKRERVRSGSLKGDNRRSVSIKLGRREARNSRSGRRLMSSVQPSEERDNGLWGEEVKQEFKSPSPPGGDASGFDYLDSSYKKRKRDKLKSTWDQLVDKIIVNNNGRPSDKKRNSNNQLDEPPLDKGKSAMEKLHFFNAEKYIQSMAKRINRLSSVDNTEQDLAAEKEAKVTKSLPGSAKLHEKRDQSRRLEDDDEDSVADYGDQIPYETGSRLVKEGGLFGKLGSDFEISISGKVHIDGESGGQPMSISIEGVSVDNATSRGGSPSGLQPQTRAGTSKNESDVRVKQAGHIYFDSGDLGRVLQDEIPANSYGKKQTFFGEAPDSGPPNATSLDESRDFVYAEKPTASGTPNSPRKTFYNVVVRAHPRYEKFPFKSGKDFARAEEPPEDLDPPSEARELEDPPENDPEKGLENLTAAEESPEPIFDFAKLELRQRRPQNDLEDETPAVSNQLADLKSGNSHSRKRRTRRLRRQRAMRRDAPGDDEELAKDQSDKPLGSKPDIKLVELIPVELLNENEEEKGTLLEGEPVDLVTSELPKADIRPGTMSAPNRSKIKPAKDLSLRSKTLDKDDRSDDRELTDLRMMKNSETSHYKERSKSARSGSENGSETSNLSTSKRTQNTRRSEAAQREKTHKPASSKFASNLAEPCLGEKETTLILDEPRNLTEKNSSRIFAGPVKGLPEIQEGLKKARLSTDDLHPSRSQPFGKSGEVLIKGVKISSPGEDPRDFGGQGDLETVACGGGECQVYEGLEDPRKATELKNLMSMMNFIKKLEDILPGSEDGVETLEESPEPKTVVEVQSVLLVPEETSEIKEPQATSERVVEIGEGVKHNVPKDPSAVIFGKDGETNLNPEKEETEKLSRSEDRVTDPGTSKSDSGKENNLETASKIEALFKTAQEKFKHRISELKKKSNSERENLRTGTSVEKEGKVRPEEVAADPKTLDDRLRGKMGNGFESKGQNESPGTAGRPVKFDGSSSKSNKNRLHGEADKIGNTLDEEGLADLPRKERRVDARPKRDRGPGRQARTPVTYTVGVSETGASEPKGEEGELSVPLKTVGEVRKEKRKAEKLGRRKKGGGKKRKKRKHRKKKKKKKRKKKKKKWWPFKRSLLAISENQETKNPDLRDQDEPWKPRSRKKRQIKAGGAQVRGGQDCMDRRHPAHVNSAKYQESAHCLRFSDLWYSVYELEAPIMEHTIYLQLFEKHTLPDGTTHWDDLTQGSMVRLGTFVRHQRDTKPTISFTYSGAKVAPQKQAHNLDPAKDRLLVPSPVAGEKLGKYPQVKGGSAEYLVVQSNAINRDGNECDKAGVGFSTFAKQPNRCGHPKGTCLKNQPLAYWRHDVEAREAGKPGCYFLSNFASVPNNPIKYNVSGTGSREYLGLEYHDPHVSAIDIEVRADYNAIVRVGSSGRVTEVYVDSTAPEHTVVTIVISNMGLASSPYQSRISDCPTGLPVSWTKAKTAMQVIPPQHDQKITLDLYGELLVSGFHCSVEVVNHRGELVAMRRIRVQKMDRCFCVWHCLCACVGSAAGLGCQPMSPEHYHAAGFQGPVPVASVEPSVMANAIKDVITFSALVILILLGLGMLKWLIGIFVPVVSRWGLDVLLAGSQMVGYFEPELRCRSIVTDLEGKVVHPDTGKKSVRICSRRSEFFLNLVFFLTFPIAVCFNFARSSLAGRKRNCCQDESKISLLRENEGTPGCPRLICVDTYGDSRNSKMEAEDTRYVINELKRSRDSLQDGIGKRCKNCRSASLTSSKNSNLREEEFVAELIRSRVVFRNLKKPIADLNVPSKTEYSLRGYFMNAENGGYRFITPCPFKQHWLIDIDNSKSRLKPAKIYPSNQFMRTFQDAKDVYESEEISLKPKGICINVQFLNEE